MKGLFMRWKARLAKVSIGFGVAGLVLGFLGGIGALAYFAESFPSWTGFNRVPEYDGQGNVTRYASAKTLWDWLNLLLVPLVLAVGGLLFTWFENRQARSIERERVAENQRVEHERAQDAVLESYLDQMTELLLTRGLRTSLYDDEVRSVARARTLTALRGVDGERKATIVRFLYEAQLIGYLDFANSMEPVNGIVQLYGADLQKINFQRVSLYGSDFREANLQWATFQRVDLLRSNFRKAELQETSFQEANLLCANFQLVNLQEASLQRAICQGADLVGSNLHGADLQEANLLDANFQGANLRGANLVGSNLHGADLSRCEGLTTDQLLQVRSLYRTILPDYIDPADLGDLWSPPETTNTPAPEP